jgi:FkbM family methyltransferase
VDSFVKGTHLRHHTKYRLLVTAFSRGNLKESLQWIGRDEGARRQLVNLLTELEPSLRTEGTDIREEITGPIVDALYVEGEQIHATLKSGVKLTFPYRSKIARDFVMSAGERPTYVWEPQTTKLLLQLAAGARHVIIGGAYFGDQAIPLAHSLQGSGGTCHCFDVNPEQLQFLRENINQNQLKNVRVNAFALWEQDERRLVLVGDDSHAHVAEVAVTETESFPSLSINTYARENSISKIDLIMLDIEGAELAALRGAQHFLGLASPDAPKIVFELHGLYTDWSEGLAKTDVCVYLTNLGYQLFAIRDYQGNVGAMDRPIELVPIDTAYIEGPPHGFNMLAIKDGALLSKDWLRVVPDVSPKLLFHRDPRLHQPRY